MKIHLKKFLLSAFVVISFSVYAISQRFQSDSQISFPIPSSNSSLPNPPVQSSSELPLNSKPPLNSPAQTTKPTAKPPQSPTPSPKPKGLYNDGEYTGNSADAYYGNVQIKAVIQGGKITDIQFLDYPRDRSNSVRINSYAAPILRTEAIQAQSANVDAVSGATDTSRAFIESLSAALTQART